MITSAMDLDFNVGHAGQASTTGPLKAAATTVKEASSASQRAPPRFRS